MDQQAQSDMKKRTINLFNSEVYPSPCFLIFADFAQIGDKKVKVEWMP